jgi:hypothetical protein
LKIKQEISKFQNSKHEHDKAIKVSFSEHFKFLNFETADKFCTTASGNGT